MGKLKLRIHAWLNTKTLKPWYGIQAKVDSKWINCCDGNKALVFDSKKDAKLRIAQLGETP